MVGFGVPVDPFDLRLYTMALASLAGTLLLCAAIAALTTTPRLVASVLGARVFRSPEREVGWWPVRTTAPGRIAPLFASMPAQLTVLHWHEDTFELPAGAALLAESEACRQQAFAFGERVLCLQFHLEMSPGDVRNLVGESTDMLVAGRFVQRAADILAAQQHFAPMYATLDGILERFALEGRDSPPERAPSATGSS